MRNVSALIVAAVLGAIVLCLSPAAPAHAGQHWPTIPAEAGVRSLVPYGWVPYRCSDGPVFNLYHGALYDTPPAIWLGYAYRPYYRYTAWRVLPRTYACAEN